MRTVSQPKEREAVAKAIMSFGIFSDKGYPRQERKGKKLVEQRYSWDVNAKRFLELYEDLCER